MSATATVERLDEKLLLDDGRWKTCKIVWISTFSDASTACGRPAHSLITVICQTCGPAKIATCRMHLFLIRTIRFIRVGCRKCGANVTWTGGRSGDRL